ncbi:MAG: amidohydrolase family protein [Acidobacteria bacterium]|nr:amidohydrolase family protein [Acidobacteriota bacterium]
MKKQMLVLGMILSLYITAGWAQNANMAALGYPQMIVFNGKIVTMDDASFGPAVGTIVQAMAIRDGKILKTGTTAEIQALAGPQTTKIDLKGRMVVPSFAHTHEHPTDWVWTEPSPMEHVIPSGSTDELVYRWLKGTAKEQLGQWQSALKELAGKAKPNQWVWLSFDYGSNFENATELVQAFPKEVTRELLDQLVPNHPARVRDAWPIGNQILVNTKGFEEAKKVFPDARMPGQGGFGGGESGVDVNGRSMEPNVILKNNVRLMADLLKAEFELWASQGITAYGSSPYASNNFRALSLLDARGEMPARFGWGYTGTAWDAETMRYIAGLLGNGTDHLWNVGAWDSSGSACTTLKPIDGSQDQGCSFEPGKVGREHLEAIIRAGGRVATMHTGGDKDIDYMMDAIVKASREGGLTMEQIRSKRHAFDHASGAPRPDQIPTMKNLGMTVSMINTDLWEKRAAYDMVFRVQKYGVESAAWQVPRRSVTAAGIPNGWEIDRALPHKEFLLIWEGMTRYNPSDKRVYGPSETTDRITQLKSLTRWGAYYLLRENLMGTLEPGKFADFLVLDRDFLTIPDDEIPNVKVLMTVVGGKLVHLMPDVARENGIAPVGPVTWPSKPLENYYKHIEYTPELLRNQPGF